MAADCMKKIFGTGLLLTALCLAGCQKAENGDVNSNRSAAGNVKIEQPTPDRNEPQSAVNIYQFAYNSPEDIEEVFGKPLEIKKITDVKAQMPGEYRLYRLNNNDKGLSVRFYRGKAVRFNVFLPQKEASSAKALRETFGVDVGGAPRVPSEQFVEKWQGNFAGLNFTTIYAMKEKPSDKGFAMVHAEIEQK